MKSYESEREELYEWIVKRTKEYFKDLREFDKEHGVHYDSEINRTFLLDNQEYNRRLRELKKKYGVE